MSALIYPKIQIRSKNELAKTLAGKKYSVQEVLLLIKDVSENKDKYWKDNQKESKPDSGKHVRSALGSPLGTLLALLDQKLLKPHDGKLPGYIFGGISHKDHVQAAAHLLGKGGERVLLKTDIKRFFENTSYQRVRDFFVKVGCYPKIATCLADICCVPAGAKNAPEEHSTLARGFATSSRLAVWCSLNFFVYTERAAQKHLHGHDPRMAVFVDDIGITASKVSKKDMVALFHEMEEISVSADSHNLISLHSLWSKKGKTKILDYRDGNFEHLGLVLGKRKISPGRKTSHQFALIKSQLNDKNSSASRRKLKTRKLGHIEYRANIEKVNKTGSLRTGLSNGVLVDLPDDLIRKPNVLDLRKSL